MGGLIRILSLILAGIALVVAWAKSLGIEVPFTYITLSICLVAFCISMYNLYLAIKR